MDLYCQRCGEPWDHDYIRHESEPGEWDEFRTGKSCPACKGKVVKDRPLRAQASGVLTELLGDDTDGIAAMMDDAEYLGLLDE